MPLTDDELATCACRPSWAGHECTRFTPAEQALSDYVHRDDGTTVLYDNEVKEAVASVRPVHYQEAAASLRRLGHYAAADLLDSVARDLTDELSTTDTEGAQQ